MMGLRDQYRQPLQRADGDGGARAADRVRQRRHAARGAQLGASARVQPADRARRQHAPAAASTARRKRAARRRRDRPSAGSSRSGRRARWPPSPSSKSTWRRTGRSSRTRSGLSVLAALAFGLAPLRTARRAPLGLVLKSSALNTTADRGRMRGSRIVLAATDRVVRGAAGRRGSARAHAAEPQRRRPRHPHAPACSCSASRAPASVKSDAAVVQFYQSLLERVRSLPGVESATLMGNRIGSGWSNNTNAIVDGAAPTGPSARMRWNNVGPDYFRVLGTPMLLGRDFTEADLLGHADGDRQRGVRASLSAGPHGARTHGRALEAAECAAIHDHRRGRQQPLHRRARIRCARWPTSCTRTSRRSRSCTSR